MFRIVQSLSEPEVGHEKKKGLMTDCKVGKVVWYMRYIKSSAEAKEPKHKGTQKKKSLKTSPILGLFQGVTKRRPLYLKTSIRLRF